MTKKNKKRAHDTHRNMGAKTQAHLHLTSIPRIFVALEHLLAVSLPYAVATREWLDSDRGWTGVCILRPSTYSVFSPGKEQQRPERAKATIGGGSELLYRNQPAIQHASQGRPNRSECR